jgi:steroid delta-isomerase-like uncharacterized protein
MATPTAENKEYVRRVETAVNDRDADAIADIVADDFVYHMELEEIHGAEEYNEYLERLYDAFPDFSVTFEEIIAEGDLVAVRYTGSGTHEGEYKGIQPTGEKVTLSGMRIVRVEDGEIVEVWAESNNLSLLAQLGVVEPPE